MSDVNVTNIPQTPLQEAIAAAKKKIADEKRKAAASKIESKLREIADAEAVLKNLQHEYDVLIATVESEL